MARTPVPSSHTLPNGLLVRVRLPVSGDVRGLQRLLDRTAHEGDDLEARRLLRFDPRKRLALVAAVAPGAAELIVGYIAGDLLEGARPDILLADEILAPEVSELLADVLEGRVEGRLGRSA